MVHQTLWATMVTPPKVQRVSQPVLESGYPKASALPFPDMEPGATPMKSMVSVQTVYPLVFQSPQEPQEGVL